MSYATPQQFIDTYPLDESYELTNLDQFAQQSSTSTTDTNRIQRALDSAYNEINSYRSAKGDEPPYYDHPPMLVDIEITIARKKLNAYSWQENDPRYRDYRDAIKWLEKFAKGEVRLPVTDTSPSIDPLPVSSAYIPNNSIFGQSDVYYGRLLEQVSDPYSAL